MGYVKMQWLLGFFGVFLVSAIMAFGFASAQEAVKEAVQETAQKTTNEDAILILDASGSMWGQIEGRAKIEIARGVLDELLDGMPASTRLGLMAYGHTKKGDCSDIELLSDIGASRATIKRAVKTINPKGKTPISASVKMAAKKLKYTEEKATVILISDGIETCNLDPCELGKQLEKDGVDFTAHVVGFDIADAKAKAQLQCLAESTGGRYLSANNANDLSIALGETVAKKDLGAKLAQLRLQATELPGGPVIKAGLDWEVRQAGGGDIVYAGDNKDGVAREIPPGAYDVFVSRTADGLKGESLLVALRPGANKTITIALKLEFEASITPDADTIAAGSEFSVAWVGPDRKSDFVTITNIGAPPWRTLSKAYTARGNPLKLTAPTTVGRYEVRYILGKPHRILASKIVEVSPVAASLDAPKKAKTGENIAVKWTGPGNKGDFIAVTKPDAKDKARISSRYKYATNGSPSTVRMPVEAGTYEIRYVQKGGKVLARSAIEIEEVSASVKGPKTALAGQKITIEWSGPGNQGDLITIVKPDARPSKFMNNAYAYTKKGSPADIYMPVEPGEYELRFVQHNKKVIARQAITIEDVSIKLTAPKSAKPREKISIGWSGPGSRKDRVIIVSADSGELASTHMLVRNGNPQKKAMPKTPGKYEIRYLLGGKRVVARQPITIGG